MGALALFIVLTGGTAYAANTIRSADIVDGQVRTQDLATGAVRTADIANGQVRGLDVGNDKLTGTDIQESTLVTGGDLTGMLDSAAIADNAISGSAIQDATLTGADLADTGTIGAAELGNTTQLHQIPANALIPAAQVEPAGTSPDIGFAGNTPVLLFDQTTLEAVRFTVRMPADRVPGTDVDVRILWSASGGAGSAVTWHFSYSSVTPGTDNVNTALTDGSVSTSNVAAANRLLATVFGSPDIPGASVANGDLLQLRLFRDAAGEPDDLAQDAALHMVEITYTADR
jgi:hypothetical protein